MANQKNGIEWTDETWNPLRGCSRVSEGCRNCYAESVARRFDGPGLPYEGLIANGGQWNGQIKLVPEKLDEPIRWQRPRRIFVNSMSDLFHPNVPDEFIDRVFGVMWACLWGRDENPGHVFQILTKRADRMRDYLLQDHRESWAHTAAHYGGGIDPDGIWDQVMDAEGPHPRIWLGVSVENQATADERIPLLLQTPAAVRWVSAEPLLGAVDLIEAMEMRVPSAEYNGWADLHWVVVGGESGHNARPMHPDWARSLRDQCKAAGVPFMFKQNGEWIGGKFDQNKGKMICQTTVPGENIGRIFWTNPGSPEVKVWDKADHYWMHASARIGKKAAGRLLDGVLHDGYPEVQLCS